MSALINEPVDAVLQTLVEEATGDLLVVDPSSTVIEKLVEVAINETSPPTMRVLAADRTLKDVVSDFLVASHAADLINDGVLSIRSTFTDPGNELLVTENRLTAVVAAGDEIVALSTDDPGFVNTVLEYFSEQWENADPYRLRTPALSLVRETLRSEISPEAEADFNAVLESLETARGNGNGLDEVTISLLIAAKNQELLYDISKWGEDIGIASKATFSRTKTMLEDMGLIDTEKVPIDVGRPRLRLKFANDRLQEASVDELAGVALSLMQ